MRKLSLAAITLDDLRRVARLTGHGLSRDPWESFVDAPLSTSDQQQLEFLVARLQAPFAVTVNESTVWARAIYPLLALAETASVHAWSQVPIEAVDPRDGTQIGGVIDGVLASEGPLSGVPEVPYLLVLEAKRGMDATDPRPQLLGALLATAWLHGAPSGSPTEVFGCYTVADTWTFVRAELRPSEATPPWAMDLYYSREYSERLEAPTILRVLRAIVTRGLASPRG